ncbi:FtsW/RodA/SpoVE family cell cycle protein [Thermodesulfatator autotrophicus]|uniref:Rod shape-determining protein RodA n=1 Tax=Thermodesulfatator autotrophicus TaxID=1795632 RepID=A0A177E4L4_9BACT|nr:FtsW/RodA/SpoVE family cell cycle protein [Thermodesulfatator autotrophicus]OAG26894.1 hypothetical protein TH606_09870 [Thermodesulfatator autotrophicus]
MKKQRIKNIYWPLLFPIFFLLMAGALNQASASQEIIFKKQLMWFFLGSLIMFGLTFVDYQKVFSEKLVLFFYVIVLCLQIYIAIKHDPSKRWINLKFFSIQPSEFAKLALIFVSAFILHKHDKDYLDFKTFGLLALFAFPLIISVAILDLDQGLILSLIFGFFVLIAGVPKRVLVLGAAFMIAFGIIVGPHLWNFLKPYQRARVEAFINPEAFALSRGYQVIQALIAVGSGGIKGQGFREGLSSRLNYLPEKDTDLAFAVWAEEWGFIGASLVILAFGVLIWQILKIAAQMRDPFDKYVCYGVAIMFFVEVFINIGGIIHILPIASIPLPFLSYGGSSVLVNMMALGMVLSASRKRYSFR